ncbi:TonB-dependent receptor [Halioxenophilus sp. WMMB6]|uniref:TonB-dependent receptor n=1 Tax=Halioxenophilus sp. WMMB6 TaxID=3073815 RepID=UPI00295EDAFA|nr:TonB-dependent receptor [Halioxenophilus sp. WMMB6]
MSSAQTPNTIKNSTTEKDNIEINTTQQQHINTHHTFTHKFPAAKPLALALAVAGASTLPTATVNAAEVKMIEEVVVTARRREESLQDVPIAVTAFSSDDLEMRGAADISELAQVTPSVTLEPSRATNSTLTAFIRGVGQQDPLAGFEQGVALYVDDVYIARPQGALLDIYDVERIEVLRGPQGTLYGRNAVGGAIKYVTRRLSDDPSLRIKAAFGTYGQQDLVLTGSMPLPGGFKVGATVANLQRDGYGDNLTTGEDNYNKDIAAYRLSAEWAPTDDLLFRLAYDNTNDESNPVEGYRPVAGAVSGYPVLGDVWDTAGGASKLSSTAGINGNNSVDSDGVNLSIEWAINDAFTLRSITAQREDYTQSVIDFDALPVVDLEAPVIYDNEQFSQELQLLYSSERLNAVTGLYYLDASAANDFDVVIGQLGILVYGAPLTAYTGGSVDTKAVSAFADVTYDITQKLSLSLGGRYTEDERTADVYRASYFGIGSPFFGNEAATLVAVSSDYHGNRTYRDFSPRINLSYQLNDDTNVYAAYSQGWKAGSFDPRGANFLSPGVEKGFDAETLNSYEAGIKATWWDGRARTNVALFYSDYEDMQVPTSVAVDSDGDGINDLFVGEVTNAGKAVIQGLEFEGLFLLTESLSVQASASILDTEIKEWLFNGEDISDQRELQNTPEKMAYLGLTYRKDLSFGGLSFNINGSYKDDVVQFETPVPAIDQKAVTVYNASAVWISPEDNWTVGLHVKNLTDKEVKTAGYCFGFEGCNSPLGLEDNNTVFYAPPRTVTAGVEYRF